MHIKKYIPHSQQPTKIQQILTIYITSIYSLAIYTPAISNTIPSFPKTMKFASLLKIHQNQQLPPAYPSNQYLVNCNINPDNPIVYGTNKFSTLKKRTNQPPENLNQTLADIFHSYEQNPHTQWILQLQAPRVRIHKFQPSKFKTKKEDPQSHQHQLYPKIPSHQRNPHPQNHSNPHQNHSNPHQDYPNPHQDYPNPHQDQLESTQRFNLRQNQQTRKNYSPMQKMRPKTFAKDQNWMENLNQNKFSFGQDSFHTEEQPIKQNYPQIENNTNNQNYIQETHNYELPQHNATNQRPKPYGVNLMNEFDRSEETQHQAQDIIQTNQKPLNQLVNLDEKNQKQTSLQQPIDNPKNPDSRIDFNPNVGFSFQQIDKMCEPTQNTIGPVSSNKVQLQTDKHVLNTNKEIISLKQPTTKPSNLHQNASEKPSLTRQTSLKKIIDEEQSNSKTTKQPQQQPSANIQPKPIQTSAPASQAKQKESSPHRIYCKANIRNLTPQKFKYPRLDSKIQSQVKPFLTETDSKNKTDTGTIKSNTDKKIENQSQKQMVTVPSSDRLLALIDESKRLLESRTVNEEAKPEDRIRRIVLHQTTPTIEKTVKSDTPQPNDAQVSENKKNERKTPNIVINEPKGSDQKGGELTPKKKEIEFKGVSSPKSPTQQKPKFHNQLANMQTNYSAGKVIIQNSQKKQSQTKKIVNLTVNAPSKHITTTNNIQQVTSNTKNHIQSNNVTTNYTVQQQQNQFQSNYAYKPLNIPQYNNNVKHFEQKDLVAYKAPQYPSNNQLINQPYQPIINTYQQLNEAAYHTQKTTTNHQVYQNPATAPLKTYSPYFPVANINKPSAPNQPIESKPSTPSAYQTYTYSNFPSSQPQIQSSTQPLTQNNNNYIKINANYISPLEKYEKKPQIKEQHHNQFNQEWKQKENHKPTVGLGIEGIKCVQSKIYEPSINKLTTVQQDPRESSVEFSLRIQEHFHLGNK